MAMKRKGWAVCCRDKNSEHAYRHSMHEDEQEARAEARLMNAASPDWILYWCEWWNTTNTFTDAEQSESILRRDGVYE